MSDTNPVPLFRYLLQRLSERNLAYVHVIEPRHQETNPDGVDEPNAPDASELLRQDFRGPIISAGNYDRARAQVVMAGVTRMLAPSAGGLFQTPIFRCGYA